MIIKGAGTVADDAVTSAKVADDAIDSEHYIDGSIDTAHIADNQVTVAKLEDIARGSIIVGNSSAASAELTKGSANTVLGSDGTDISYVSITSAMITDGTIATADIADNNVTAAKIFDLARGSILIGNASAATAELTKGSANYVLTSDGTDIAWASASGGASQANQAAVEGETNEDTYVPPDLLKHAPGMAKGWCQYEQTGTHGIITSYNVTSVTDRGVGQTDVTWATDFSGADYAVSVTPVGDGSGSHEITEQDAGKTRTYTRDTTNSGSVVDLETCCIAWGDQ